MSDGLSHVPNAIRQQIISDQQTMGQIATVYFDTTSSDHTESDVEWTPQDSSYGAACPVCGCIPKNIRQMIESLLLVIIVSAFVAGIVKLITPLTFFHSSNSSTITSNSTSTNLVDDDFYVEYQSYTINSVDDYYKKESANGDDTVDDFVGNDDDAASSNQGQ